MLQDKYLPNWDIRKKESILIERNANQIFPFVNELDFSNSKTLYWLFKLRGIPVPQSLSLKGLERINFIRLEAIDSKEIIVGLIGKFWTINGSLKRFYPEDFIHTNYPGYAKVTWSFMLVSISENSTLLTTETRVACLSRRTRQLFRVYWFFIGLFSSWVRAIILKGIKKKAESANYNQGAETIISSNNP